MSFFIGSSFDKFSPRRTFEPMGSQLIESIPRSHAASSSPVPVSDMNDEEILGLTDDPSIRVGENALSFQNVIDLLRSNVVKDLNLCRDVHPILSHDELHRLFDALKHNSSLQSLNLSGQPGIHFIPLIEGYLNSGNCGLKKLNLQNCGIGFQELEILSQVMKKQTSLTEILLDDNSPWEHDYEIFWENIKSSMNKSSSTSTSSTSEPITPEKNVWGEIKAFLQEHHFIVNQNWALNGDFRLEHDIFDSMMSGRSCNHGNARLDEQQAQKAVELLQYELLDEKERGPLPLPMELSMINPSNFLYRAIYVQLRLNLIKSVLHENSQPAMPAPSAFDSTKPRARL